MANEIRQLTELTKQSALVKGDNHLIDEQTRKQFLHLRQTGDGFEGITNQKKEVLERMPGVLMERPTIEDIMLAYIGGGKNVAAAR
ncbi:hypothetical protein BpJC4_10150 [Weizmannia acidilactici]|nr:hypothetical protein [Weizmannia acidilactici]GER66544.1 hypothetical protein BpJC4_10150 [Weizmannia acidilactici]GER74564.1 hypothetical protein BpPP18_26310 [Weizmannia acidilactici]